MAPADDEDAMLAQAIALSMAANDAPAADTEMTDSGTANGSNAAVDDALNDADFMGNLIDSLPGVNQGDINVQDILQSLNDEQKDEEAKNKKKDEK